MSTDLAVFLQSALDMDKVEWDSQGRWRIFSKNGSGYSHIRYFGEVLSTAYACLPVLDASGQPIVDKGLEFIINVRGSVYHDYEVFAAEDAVKKSFDAIVGAIYAGQLE